MEKELKIQSIVVLAQSFNTTIFNPHWLLKHGFFKETEIQPESIFTQNLTHVVTKKYNLLVVPEQLQFNAGPESTDFANDIRIILLPIINKLLEIPYKAIGINLNWLVKDEKKDIQTLTKELFFNQQSRLFAAFESGDPRFGAYLSKDFNNTRLKLDIKPVHINLNDNTNTVITEHILCNFNFHLDLNNPYSATEDLIQTIQAWETFKKESEKIIELL